MLKKSSFFILFFLFLILIPGFVYAQPIIQWEKSFGGYDDETANSVQQTNDGGYIVAGSVYSSENLYDFYLVKTDVNGNMQWDRTFGGIYDEEAHSVQQTNDGGYIVAGDTSSLDENWGDIYLIKTDANGNKQWNKTFGISDWDAAYSIQKTSDGGYIIAGDTTYPDNWNVYLLKIDSSGNKQWDRTFGVSGVIEGASDVQQTSDGGYIISGEKEFADESSDFYLIKTDSSGNMQWDRTFNKKKNDYADSVQQTNDGGYIISGDTSIFLAEADIYLVKTDSSGNKQWDRTFGGDNVEWAGENSVQQTNDGGYIVAGFSASFDVNNYGEAYLVKTDSSGNIQWNKTFGGQYSDGAQAVRQTSDNGYIVAGLTFSITKGLDVYLVKLSSGPVQTCSDGTLYGSCSATKPLYCSNGNLINDCSFCGCNSGYICQPNNMCSTHCNDGVKNGDEAGVDCGGSCPKVCGYCKPYILNGDNKDKIDVVFIPDVTYNNNTALFLQHIGQIINSSYKNSTPIKNNINKFNFYYIEEESWTNWGAFRHNLPKNFKKECSFYDAAAIIHIDRHRDFALGNVFSSEYYSNVTFIHESGHAVFGLADEYCCDSSYFKPKPFPNIWKSNQSCRQDAVNEGWNPDDCWNFCPTGQGNCGGLFNDGWWRSDPDPDIMSGGWIFQRADLRNVYWTFDQYPNVTIRLASLGAGEENKKVAVLDLYFKNNKINLTSLKIIYNNAPEYFSENGELNFSIFDNNTIVKSFLIRDPRIILTENESVYQDTANFTISVPLNLNEDKINIYNSTNLLLSVNVTPFITDFCSYKDGICNMNCGKLDSDWPAGDVNSDGKVNIFDLAKIGLCYNCVNGQACWSSCSVADLNADNVVNIFDLATVGLGYGREC